MLFHPHYEYIICVGGTTDVEHHSVVGIGYLVGTDLGCYLFVKVEESGSEYLSLCPPGVREILTYCPVPRSPYSYSMHLEDNENKLGLS